jgi:hypothetical protein
MGEIQESVDSILCLFMASTRERTSYIDADSCAVCYFAVDGRA